MDAKKEKYGYKYNVLYHAESVPQIKLSNLCRFLNRSNGYELSKSFSDFQKHDGVSGEMKNKVMFLFVSNHVAFGCFVFVFHLQINFLFVNLDQL